MASTTKKIISIASSFVGTSIIVPLIAQKLPRIISKLHSEKKQIETKEEPDLVAAEEGD